MFTKPIRSVMPLLAAALISASAAHAQDKVTAHNYVRAESDFQFRSYVEKTDCFGKFHHNREAYDVDLRVTIRPNRDTLYSFGVFDLTSPVTITMPDPGERYQSAMMISQDHSIFAEYGPKTFTLTEELVGTRYVLVAFRTFMDPNSESDMKAAHTLQDKLVVRQRDRGTFDLPYWNEEEINEVRTSINVVGTTVTDASKMFGLKDELDPVYHLLGAALGWGGLPAKAATYGIIVPEKNDGKTAYTVTVKDVPVDAFWSITVYDGEGFMQRNELNAYSFNNITAARSDDGSITIHFGGDADQPNYLPIMDGWNYAVRMYKPRKELLDGTWTFPAAVEVK